ncbi:MULTISPECIES: GtrA family protein [Streptomyces]|uniref:GtrA/DPMS transmembrane domain-containing protein n=1 Tax=Streptomyces plumbiresistens TaxID=511811 RepID=A0ABP7PZS6_9ACTN|nr:GtrA family protein [Streptomyces sp. NBC_01373]MCX4698352.1 GtrA family protein [Streptomyces sp. NBC_01373]
MTETTATIDAAPEKQNRTLRQLVSYTLIGGSGVALDFVVFLLLHNLTGMDEQLANALSTTLGIANNFVLNALFTFERRDRIVLRFLRFYAVGLTGIVLTNLLFLVFTDGLGIDANLVKAGSLPLVLALQFVLNRKWSFA